MRCFVRRGRTDRRIDHDSCIRSVDSRHAVFAQLCGRGYDLRCRGGADTRNVRGRTLQYRRFDVCSRIYGNDDFGYHFGMNTFKIND